MFLFLINKMLKDIKCSIKVDDNMVNDSWKVKIIIPKVFFRTFSEASKLLKFKKSYLV